MGGTAETDPLLVVYADQGNHVHDALSRRLAAAAASIPPDRGRSVRLEAARALKDLDIGSLAASTVLLVSPATWAPADLAEAARLAPGRRLIAVVTEGERAVTVAAGPATALALEAVIEVGFVPQPPDASARVPRIFLYNAPLPEEADLIRARVPGRRLLPWAVVGQANPRRAALADSLVRQLSPHGIVFMPSRAPEAGGGGRLSRGALERLLSVTSCYVWCSDHPYACYESYRFLEALLGGAVPCKIEPRDLGAGAGLPNVYRTVTELAERLDEEGPEPLFDDARRYYLAHGTLGEHLARVLGDV